MTLGSEVFLNSNTAPQEALLVAVRAEILQRGYWVGRGPEDASDARRALVALARGLGDLYVPEGCDETDPVIATTPNRRRSAAPFDRPEAIGWHGDFASHQDRPELSLVHITRSDSRDPDAGAWRLASSERVVARLEEDTEGQQALAILSGLPLPFSYRPGQTPRWFVPLDRETNPDARLRYYAPSIRQGCESAFGKVPTAVSEALSAFERAADAVADVRRARVGDLLVTHNWLSLHDRTRQTISRTRPNREALLAFVRAIPL